MLGTVSGSRERFEIKGGLVTVLPGVSISILERLLIPSEGCFFSGANERDGVTVAVRGVESAGSERVRVRLSGVSNTVPRGRNAGE